MPTIARVWRGATLPSKAEAYHEYLLKTGVPDAQATPGNQGVFVMRRVSDGLAEFVVMSLWESQEAVRRFAGERIERPVHYGAEPQYLVEDEPTVRHYEVLFAPDRAETPAPAPAAV
jgi:heme-degrading monooxygenase HmoA